MRFPFGSNDYQAAMDAADRLAVLYPRLLVRVEPDALLVEAADSGLDEGLQQAIRDQLIRARYGLRTAALRERLYQRLLD